MMVGTYSLVVSVHNYDHGHPITVSIIWINVEDVKFMPNNTYIYGLIHLLYLEL